MSIGSSRRTGVLPLDDWGYTYCTYSSSNSAANGAAANGAAVGVKSPPSHGPFFWCSTRERERTVLRETKGRGEAIFFCFPPVRQVQGWESWWTGRSSRRLNLRGRSSTGAVFLSAWDRIACMPVFCPTSASSPVTYWVLGHCWV